MTLRARFLERLAQLLGVPAYFELLPVEPRTFANLSRDFASYPTVFNRAAFEQAVWPRPNMRYRVFVQIVPDGEHQ